MIISETIKMIREELGLKQHELASKAGVSQVLISTIESGKKKPSMDTLKAIAAAFGISYAELMLRCYEDDELGPNGSEMKDEMLALFAKQRKEVEAFYAQS